MISTGMTRRDLLRGMSGLIAASVLPLSSSVAIGPPQAVRLAREFSIKGYDRVLLPRGHGQLTELTKPVTRRYPSRDHCMQMAAFFSGSSGLLIHTKDPIGYFTEWEIIPGDKLRIHFSGPEPEIEVKAISPTVEAAAEHYKQWARQQTWAAGNRRSALPFSLIAVAANPNLSQQYLSMRKLSTILPAPFGAWITQWRRHEFDTMYPDYEPGDRRAFQALLTGLKDLQCTAFPYVNGLLWDARLKSFSLGESVGLRNSDGSLLRYSHKLPWLTYACPAAKAWQETIIQSRQSLQDLTGAICPGVYLDMLLAAGPYLCFATNHGHSPGDPLAWQRGIREILTATQGIIMSEANAEIYIDRVDAVLMHLYTAQSDVVPLWKHVYGDLVTSVGWEMPANPTPDELRHEIGRAKEFGASCNGSPWMTHTVQELLFRPQFRTTVSSLAVSSFR